MKHIILSTSMLCVASLAFAATELQPYYLDNPGAAATTVLAPAQQDFFDYYTNAMRAVSTGNAEMTDFFNVEYTAAADEVAPVLGDIAFDQGTPYNNLCPVLNGGRAVTGCVATAMAEVMARYKYPACGTGNVKYSGGSGGAVTMNLADYPFDWKNVLPTYKNGEYNDAQADAVARLMLCCGASIDMNYSAGGSGTQTSKSAPAFINNFGFTEEVRSYNADSYPDKDELFEYDWGPTIREQTGKGYPVIWGGSSALGATGHCFVIDGYKVIDGVYYYHVNWGWNGSQNGYFLLTRLEAGGSSYSGANCTMVINLYPKNWTPIDNVVEDAATGNNTIYNLLGQPVAPDSRQVGNIYIQNGKKYLYR